MEHKLGEWRPEECGTRLADVVVIGERQYLKIKCRRCSKLANRDIFHLSVPLDAGFTTSVDQPA